MEVRDGMARVAMQAAQHEACGHCGFCRRAEGGKVFLLEASAPEEVRAGDTVTVEIPVPGVGLSATLLLLIPLVLFGGGVVLGEWLRAAGLLPGGSGVSALIGLVLMGLSYVGAALYDRHLRRAPEHQPTIVEWRRQGPGESAGP